MTRDVRAGHATSLLERAVAALGLVLVAGTIILLVRDAGGEGDPSVQLAVRIDSIIPRAGGHAVHFTARNAGRATAADVAVRGERRDAAGSEESAATLDYVPGRSSRRGTLYFGGTGAPEAVRLRVEGFREP